MLCISSFMDDVVFILFDQSADGLRQNKVTGQTYKFDSAKDANTEFNVMQLQCLVVHHNPASGAKSTI